RLRAGEMAPALGLVPLLHTLPLSAFWRMDSSGFDPPIGGGSVHIDGHVLGFQVLLYSLEAALAPDARPLHTAEWRSGVRDHALVEADHAAFEPLDHADRALEVAREHV